MFAFAPKYWFPFTKTIACCNKIYQYKMHFKLSINRYVQ
jgi:hypothetical protein